jgi:hypothetical protein
VLVKSKRCEGRKELKVAPGALKMGVRSLKMGEVASNKPLGGGAYYGHHFHRNDSMKIASTKGWHTLGMAETQRSVFITLLTGILNQMKSIPCSKTLFTA